MYNQPKTLLLHCIRFICDNIQLVFRVQSSNSTGDDDTEESIDRDLANRLDNIKLIKERLPNQMLKDVGPDSATGDTLSNQFGPSLTVNIQETFSGLDVRLPQHISEQLLERLSDQRKLDDSTIQIFQPQNTTLGRLVIRYATDLTQGALGSILKKHKLMDIEIVHLSTMSINELIACLGEWTIRHLRTLHVEGMLFTPNNDFALFSKLRTLRSLSVTNTEFNDQGLEVIAGELNCLEIIDISLTKVTDISPLGKCKDKIKELAMLGVIVKDPKTTGSVLLDLRKLEYLDVSSIDIVTQPMNLAIVKIMTTKDSHPCLTSLDISGNYDGVTEDMVRFYLESHSQMEFLGLARGDNEYSNEFLNALQDSYPDLAVAALGNGKQITTMLKRYRNRKRYLKVALEAIDPHYTSDDFSWEDIEEVLRMLIKTIQESVLHKERVYSQNIQQGLQDDLGIITIDCIYIFLKDENFLSVHPTCRREIVECLLRVHTEVTFDNHYYDPIFRRLLKHVMLNDEMPFYDKNCGYIRTLLHHIKQNTHLSLFNEKFKRLTQIICIITDEAAGNCKIVVRENGVGILMYLLQVKLRLHTLVLLSPIQSSIAIATLAALNNIAEVKELRKEFMKDNFIKQVTLLLDSDPLSISYFSAGILANLISDSGDLWATKEYLQESCSHKLMTRVLNWTRYRDGLASYLSFCPLFQLLKCYDVPAVQLWAAWAIRRTCDFKANTYFPMLIKEGGKEILERTLQDSTSEE